MEARQNKLAFLAGPPAAPPKKGFFFFKITTTKFVECSETKEYKKILCEIFARVSIIMP